MSIEEDRQKIEGYNFVKRNVADDIKNEKVYIKHFKFQFVFNFILLIFVAGECAYLFYTQEIFGFILFLFVFLMLYIIALLVIKNIKSSERTIKQGRLLIIKAIKREKEAQILIDNDNEREQILIDNERKNNERKQIDLTNQFKNSLEDVKAERVKKIGPNK